jgi:thiamine transport system ATP-binding protein
LKPQIRLESVTAELGSRAFHYDLALEGPGIVAVTGPSGSGKSTLFHLAAGFEAPKSGRILLNGEDVTGLPPGKRPLTYIFQDHNLFAHLDVFTNIALGISPSLSLSLSDRARITQALSDVGLGGFESRMTQALSGGERQRVAFARALVRRRPFLLLDEAFASLDESLRLGMGMLLKTLQQDHQMMVLMISHHPEEIVRLADRVVEIQDGSSVFSGDTSEWQKFAKKIE